MEQSNKSKKNTGELSELYVFLSALRDSRIYAADEDLNKIDDLFFTINQIISGTNSDVCNYIISDDGLSVDIIKNSKIIATISKDVIVEDAEFILDALESGCTNGTINIDPEPIKNRYCMKNVSTGSNSKVDIVLELYDYHLGTTQVLPFSIKSFMGNNPTLLNSSGLTNFIYRIDGNLSQDEIEEINSKVVIKRGKEKADVVGRTKAIFDKGCNLVFEKVQGSNFEGNLRLIDSLLPEIIAELLILRFKTNNTKISNLTDIISENNPLKFSGKQEFYRIKIQRLLIESFMGMVPKSVWNGYASVHGGYIVVKPGGEIVCYHLSNRNKFEDYLFKHAYLDTHSVSRGKFASIEKDENGLIYKLNLDIRLSG